VAEELIQLGLDALAQAGEHDGDQCRRSVPAAAACAGG
jgi:hypothetical protein